MFAYGMVRIRDGRLERVPEHRLRLGELNAVIFGVPGGLAWIPLELHGSSVEPFAAARRSVFLFDFDRASAAAPGEQDARMMPRCRCRRLHVMVRQTNSYEGVQDSAERWQPEFNRAGSKLRFGQRAGDC